MAQRHRKIGQILVSLEFITEEQLNSALEEQKSKKEQLGVILNQLGYISREELAIALAEQFGMERAELTDVAISSEVIKRVPLSIARREKIIPVRLENNTLTVAMSNPLDLLALDNLRVMLGFDVKGAICTEEEIKVALDKYYRVEEKTIDSMIQELSEQDISFVQKEEAAKSPAEIEVEEEAPVIKLVSMLITEAFRNRASDIHIEPLEDKFRIRYRIDGVLREVPGPPKRLQGPVISRVKIMSGMDIAEKRLPQDGRIKIPVVDRELDLRVSTLPGLFGESVVLRILDKKSLMLGLEELGFLPEDRIKFEGLIKLPNGILLVTGPTGSGKTTTLYGCLNKLNEPNRKIITVEDPVEYQLSGINQTQVLPQIGLTFAAALRSMLRQAPDVIMVGEIRDFETAEIAIRSALTGHLVFSTLHTNDAPGAITRLIDMGVRPFLVASSVQGVLAQRLVRTICPDCKEAYKPRADEIEEIKCDLKEVPDVEFYHGTGCDQCSNTGYRGRIAIFELFEATEEIQELILHRSSTAVIRDKARQLGMKTLREDGWLKVLRGMTTTSEVARVTQQDVE